MKQYLHRYAASLKWLLFTSASLIAVTACSSSPTFTNIPSPTLTPTPEPVDVPTLLAASADQMAGLQSFTFRITHSNGGTDLGGDIGIVFEEISGTVARPDKMRVQMLGKVRGLAVDLEVISVGGETYVSNPLTGTWSSVGASINPFAFFDPQGGIVNIMATVEGAVYLGDGTLEGEPVHIISGSISAQLLSSFLGEAVGTGTLEAEVWIGTNHSHLRKVELRGLLTPVEEPGIIRTIELAGYDETFNIEPPI
jgi:hypothetical protein